MTLWGGVHGQQQLVKENSKSTAQPQWARRALALHSVVLILAGSHGLSSCLGGQNRHPRPRLAVQSSESRARSHHGLSHKAISVVWQHNSCKQHECTGSRIAKGSGLIFLKKKTSDFLEFGCGFSNTLIPALPQSTGSSQQSPPLKATPHWLEVSFWRRGTLLAHRQVSKRSLFFFPVLGLFSSWYNQTGRKEAPKNNK